MRAVCCTTKYAPRPRLTFDRDFRTFALRVTPEDIQRWGEAVNAEMAKGSKKKTTVKK